MPSHYKEVVYTCTKCNHKQTIRFFLDESVLPVTCCVKCRAGFGLELAAMGHNGIGMMPGKSTAIGA